MNLDTAKWCRSCKGCQTAKISRHNKLVFGKFGEPTVRFDHIHIDIVRPLPYADGFRYLLTCVDRFTCWPEAIPLVDIRAETIADAFFSGWIAQFWTPATIITDGGAQFESKLWDGLCKQFGIVRNRTTSYHPQSNGMVERFHRQLKAAIMAHESPNPWTTTPPAVILGARSAVKELLGRSAAEIVYGTTFRLPGEFSHKYIVDAHTDLDNYSDKLRVSMSCLRLCPPRDSPQNNIFQYKGIDTCSHVFLRRIAIAPPLTAPYDGPYKVIVRSGRVMKIQIKGKVETVSLDRVKPAHLDNEPDIGTEKQRKTQNNTKNSKNTATVRKAPALKQNSEKKRAELKAKTQTRSVAVQNGTNLATTSQHNTNRVNLPKQFTCYLAPHSRTPSAPRTIGSGGGLRRYSRVPLHLRDKTPNSNETTKPLNVKNNSNIANGDQLVPDATAIQTRVGRKIHTPARFVQMVHALVAPNDIDCGTSCTSRNNHN